ncbi:MAG: hypothetical protein JNM03_07920 [Sphingopyxis sp.]|uniref:hypothetical protein n=1 Tax=Sphingopyxis sp. TaxID=1908224 RepID=UPI001A3D8424|nr:hypothetical protein [Sphingopyxis sp.]MBL9069905.1 hypothetical protein [Sphingopyxis sp.]
MTRKRFAIVTFDPDRVKALAPDTSEQEQLGRALVGALRGIAYAKNCGLLNVTLMDQVAPSARAYDHAIENEITPPLRGVGGAPVE